MSPGAAGSAPEEGPGLYLVGTVHLDREAAPTLEALLDRLRPQGVTVEISRFSVEFRTEMEAVWLRRLEAILEERPHLAGHHRMELLRRQLAMPFEWSTALGWCWRRGVPCLAVDWGVPSREELPTWLHGLITPENLELLAQEPPCPLDRHLHIHRERARRAFLEATPTQAPWSDSPLWVRREKILIKRVERLLKRFERMVHIGGWNHALPWVEGTLASALIREIKRIFLVLPEEAVELPPQG